jgi:protease-4
LLQESPVADPFGLMAGEMTSLKDLVQHMEKASADSEVKAVILTFGSLQFGLGQLQELRQSIERLKTAGKKVYVHAEAMDTRTYALLCVGSRLSVAPQSSLWLTGIYGESLYVKGLLDKIGVQADYLHMGDYKSAAEMLTRTSPSAQAEENLNWVFDGFYNSLVEMIAKSRGKKAEEIRDLIDHGPYLAEQALQKGLIDAVETREEFLAQVRKEVGEQMTVNNRYGRQERTAINLASPLAIFSLLAEMFKAPAASQKDAIALIYIEGAVLPGYSAPSLFGAFNAAFSGDIQKALEKAAETDSVKAVVMRVDSPGGLQQAIEYAAAKVSLKDYEVRVIPEPQDFLALLMGEYSGEGERPTDVTLSGATSLFANHPTLAPLLDLLRKTEPQRAAALAQALQRIELLRKESVILMMPFDMVLQ